MSLLFRRIVMMKSIGRAANGVKIALAYVVILLAVCCDEFIASGTNSKIFI